MKRSVGILLFDDVEVLDFAGPFEVFAVASQVHNYELFDVFTVGKTGNAIAAVNGLSVNPKYSFETAPELNILVIPGGVGSRQVIKDRESLDWVETQHLSTELTLTVCSGSLVLAVLGHLEGQPVCTHAGVYETLEALAPTAQTRPDLRFVNAGKIWTSAGISAGIDLSLHIVSFLHGEGAALATADYMEYQSWIRPGKCIVEEERR